MTIAFRSASTPVTVTSGNLTPTAPAGFQTGDALIVASVAFGTGLTTAVPSGWSLLTLAGGAAPQCQMWGKIAVGGDTMPSLAWGTGWAAASCAAFTGVDANFTLCMTNADRSSTSANVIPGVASTRTPSQSGCIILVAAKKDKTSTGNGAVYSTPTVPSGVNPVISPFVPAGGNVSDFVWWYQIQSSVVTISPNQFSSSSGITDSSLNYQATQVGFLPATGGGGGGGGGSPSGSVTNFPPGRTRRTIIINNYYPR